MRSLFADSSYFVALLNPRDPLHSKALSISARVEEADLLTSELVSTEFLNHFCEGGPGVRNSVTSFVRRLYASKRCRIVPLSASQFQDALTLYEGMRDKGWSLTDCSSILIMREERIQDALSHDRHFSQAGLVALMREN